MQISQESAEALAARKNNLREQISEVSTLKRRWESTVDLGLSSTERMKAMIDWCNAEAPTVLESKLVEAAEKEARKE